MQLVFALHRRPPGRAGGRAGRPRKPLLRTVDLDRGESQVVELADGTKAQGQAARRGGGAGRPACSAIRQARVKVEVNGRTTTLVSANYRLPVTVGGRADRLPGDQGLLQELRPVRGFLGPGQGRAAAALAGGLALGRAGDVRVPHQAALVRRRRRRWPTSRRSSTAATPRPAGRSTTTPAWTSAGCEGLVDVVSASDGLVVSAGGKALPEYPDIPFYKRARLRLRLRPRRPGVVLPLRPPEVDRPGDPPGGAGQDGPEDRRARQGGLERRLVAPALRHQGPAALGQVGHPGGLRLPLGGLPARAQAADHRRGAAAPPDLGRREGGPRRLALLERGGQDRPLRVDVHRRDHRDRAARGTHLRASRGNTARSSRSSTPGAGWTTTSRSCWSSTRRPTASPRPRSTRATRRPSASARATR